jgi:hypothetical protein
LRSSLYHDPTGGVAGDLIPTADQQAFLLDDLRCTAKPWKIVVVHHPPYTSKSTDLDRDGMADDDEFRTRLESYFGGFEDLGVDLVISAHEKFYEQTHAVRFTNNTVEVVQQGPHFTDPGAPVYVVTGGGGERLWECLPGEAGCREGQLEAFTMAMFRSHHFVELKISGDTLSIQPFDEDGNPIDLDPGDPGRTDSTIRKSFPFKRGDANTDNSVNLADPIFTLNYLFASGPPPSCADAADANDDGGLNIADAVYSLNHLFRGGPAPPPPGTSVCGGDPTPDALALCDYPACGGPLRSEACQCDDGLDNDGDGSIDCDDADCSGDVLSEVCHCSDGLDNDKDLDVDCNDDDCTTDPNCP